ncbi:trypsin-like peptidase domain-containing protein [Teichococcus vastitatis]|uniref:Trypsin-like peptidase domain-containing protein n=1 Tax=Teichococcus vastitatis TaxID=2307076 RepID=A0ABS9W636_9PROT|nr:trypsin-like peptidase domain-containing protein [Pseudoroseomonas vastitatis]MCI0754676.1 trypsin-like peptidase domain-containing protein [Pseudoroseomonas vastitatis]
MRRLARHSACPPRRPAAALAGALLLAACAVPEWPQERDSLAAVSAGTAPNCRSSGVAVHIGRQRFLTAAHLVDGTQALLHGCAPPSGRHAGVDLDRSPGPASLSFAGREWPAEVLRTGQADLAAGIGTFYVGGRDVALLRTGPLPPGAPALPLCATAPRPGQRVMVETPRRRTVTEIAALVREASPLHGGYAELPLRLEPGESGGAVVDVAGACLAGLVSHRQERDGIWRTRFVPAPVLRAFLGE